MKKTLVLALALLATSFGSSGFAGEESKTWPASEKAQQFVKDTIVVGFFASPGGAGWTEDAHLHDYLQRSRDAGITGHSMTLAAASHTFENFISEHHRWRSTMAQTPDKFTFVRSIRDIETAHIRGTTAVIWNTQTSTILNGDLTKVATLKEMGIGSMILTYNDLFRAGSGSLAEFNGNATGVTSWGLAIIDEMVKYGIIVDLSHMGPKTTDGIMDYMESKYPDMPFVFTHSLPIGLYKDEPKATKRGCYRNITDEEALRAAKSGGYVSPTFTEWMMDGIWPDDITPGQAAEMIDYYVRLVGVDHVGIASDDMFTTEPTMDFVAKNAAMYADDGYMVNAFNLGASGCGEFSKILAAVTDELWKMGYSNEDLEKVYGRNKMRVYREVWEGFAPEDDPVDADERYQVVDELRKRFQSR
ncbi:MAG: dipeptidase [bacterium]|nr:dipeptidase [bacterium]